MRRRVDGPGEMPLQDGGYGQDERISTAVAVDLNGTGAYWMGGPMSRCLPPCLGAALLSNSNSNVRAYNNDMASGGELLRNTVQLPPSCQDLFLPLKSRGTDSSGIRG